MSDDPDPDDAAPFGFADEPPPPPVPDHDLVLERAPKRKRRRKADPDEHPVGEVREGHRDRILDRPDPPPAVPWWLFPVVVLGVGFLLCLIPIAYVAAKVGVSTGLVVMGGMLAAILVQIVGVTALLTIVGTLFGIEYGTVKEALLKLAAVVTIIDGMTGTFVLCNSPCALAMATVLGCCVFQYLFRLQIHEMLLSVAGMVFFAFLLNGVALSLLMSNAMPQ